MSLAVNTQGQSHVHVWGLTAEWQGRILLLLDISGG